VADQDYIRDWQEQPAWSEEDGTSTADLSLTYYLTNGLEVERRYSLLLTRERMDQAGTYDDLLDALVNSEAMKVKRLRAGDSRYTVAGGSLWLEVSSTSFDLNSREAAAVLDAIVRDSAAGAWGNYDWYDQNYDSAYAMSLDLRFEYLENDEQRYDWISINIRPGMDHTVVCLKELGVLTDQDLVTREELNRMEYDPDTGRYYETDSGVGVIGGADGVTAIFVTGG